MLWGPVYGELLPFDDRKVRFRTIDQPEGSTPAAPASCAASWFRCRPEGPCSRHGSMLEADLEEVYTSRWVLLAPVASVRSNPEKLGKTV